MSSKKLILSIIRNAGWQFLPICIFFMCFFAGSVQSQSVKTGAHILIEHHLEDLENLRVGLVMNPTSRIDGVHMLDTLLSRGVDIRALYAPEHGFRGNYGAGEIIADGIDEATGLPVHSLYGNTRKPTSEMLENIDLLIFDMQDVGARFYTYISTMGLVMEAASEEEKQVWILDRPNPAGGDYVAGWTLDLKHKSFVGMYPIPIAHGMTVGELALMIKDKNWVSIDGDLSLRIIQMQGWNRDMKWPDTGLDWIPPSPNLPTFFHSWIYLGTCLIEGTNMSEGRGTDDPFLIFGSPTLDNEPILAQNWENYFEVSLQPEIFTPISIPGKAWQPKHEDKLNKGIRITSDNLPPDPVAFGVEMLRLLLENDSKAKRNNFLKNLSGLEDFIYHISPYEFGEVGKSWSDDVSQFLEKRNPYLLY